MDRRSLLKLIPAIGAAGVIHAQSETPMSEALPVRVLQMRCEKENHGCGALFQFHLGSNAVCPRCFMTWWVDVQGLQRGDYDLRSR